MSNFYEACEKGDIERVKCMLKDGADPNEGMIACAKAGNLDILYLLVEIWDANEYLDETMSISVRKGDIKMVKYLYTLDSFDEIREELKQLAKNEKMLKLIVTYGE